MYLTTYVIINNSLRENKSETSASNNISAMCRKFNWFHAKDAGIHPLLLHCSELAKMFSLDRVKQ